MAERERLDEDSLSALLSDEIRAAQNYDRSELSGRRSRNLEYYRGEMRDTPSMEGRSQVVSRDTADTIGWMLPGIIRVFTASDRMAEYEPVGEEDDGQARAATDYCNYIFWKDNAGYRILWNGTHDSLLHGNGVIKHYWDETEESTFSVHSGLTLEQVTFLSQDASVEIVAHDEDVPQVVETPEGQQVIPTFKVKLSRTDKIGRVRVECIKPEDFYLDSDATCIEDARFVAHREEVTRSALIEMGFDRETVEGLPRDHLSRLSEEDVARDEEYDGLGKAGHPSMDLIELFECYVRADVDGDGIAELVRAYYAGSGGQGELLDWEVWDDDVPFSDIPCNPVPHRWDAQGVADEVNDIQRVKTILNRGLLDNVYWLNNPMIEVEENSVVNPDSLLTPTFGGTIWRKANKATTAPIKPVAIPFVGDKLLMALEHMDSVVEKRTGVSRATMALDPNTLQNQTATANQNQRDAAYSQIELIARNQAELGWRRVFRQILRLIVKHQDHARVIRLRNQPMKMDPRYWNADMDVTINVGLGTGSRDRDMAMMNNILQTQEKLTQRLFETGFREKALEMLPKVVTSMIRLAESAGIKNPETYFPEITPQAMQEMAQQAAQKAQQPDPKMIEAQQKIQLEREKAQAQGQIDLQKINTEAELKRYQIEQEMTLKREQLAAELQMKRELSMLELQVKRETGFYSADAKARAMNGSTSGVHMGGAPG